MTDNTGFYIEVRCRQKNHEGERICGDVFLSERIKEENRIIAVLSDGMGHGVKANILATLTATRITSYNVCYTKLLRNKNLLKTQTKYRNNFV